MKPHEETWEHRDGEEMVRVSGKENIRVVVYATGAKSAAMVDVARMVASAPEMARALLAMHKSITFEERTAARLLGDAALRKAGVLP